MGHAVTSLTKRSIWRLTGFCLLLLLGLLSGCVNTRAVLYGGSAGTGVGTQKVDIKDGVVELTTPVAVSDADRYRSAAPHDALITYSLKAAATALSNNVGSLTSLPKRALWQVGGINSILGAIIDPATEDVIIVGRQDLDLPPLTLDELITILRATFVVHKAPFISIDPPQQKALLNDGTTVVETIGAAQKDPTIPAFQTIRTDGGVVNTQVGANMIDADFRMKLIMLGLLSSGVDDVDIAAHDLSLTSSILLQLDSQDRFEFYPDANGIYVDRLFVVLAGGGLLAVRTEREKGASELASAEHAFAGALSAHTRELAARHTTIGNVYIYSQLHALAVGLEEAKAAPYVTPLLDRYQAGQVPTVPKIPQIMTARSLVAASRHGAFVRSIAWLAQISANAGTIFHGGGVTLCGYSVASALRQDGLSLRSAILKSRPNSSAISWIYGGGGANEVNAGNVGNLIGISDVSVELQRLRTAVATGLVETVMALAERIFHMTTQEAAVQEAGRAVALTAILSDREKSGAQLLSESPPVVRNRNDIRALIGLLEAVVNTRNGVLTASAITSISDSGGSSSLIWALALKKIGQTEKACSIIPDLREEFVNRLTVDLALECADQRRDANALARYLALSERVGLRVLAANYYRGEIERLNNQPDIAATWYYSYLGEELNPDDSQVKLAQAFLNGNSESRKVHPFDVPAGYGVVVLIRNGQWAGSANGRLVTSQSGAEIYGRLGPGEFLVIPLRPGATVLRLLGSLAIGLRKELTVNVKAGEISVFDVQTVYTSTAASASASIAGQNALSCANTVSNNSPMASGGQLAGIALGCLAVGTISGLINWVGEKHNEKYDVVIGPSLDAKPVLGESWRQLIQSMRPAEPWGGSSM